MAQENIHPNSADAHGEALNHRTVVGRRRRANTEKKIIHAAVQVFAKQDGLNAPVIDDFIKAAGIARGTFYNYFKSTDELLRATSELLAEEQAELIGKIVDRCSKDPVIRFGVGLRIWLRWAEADPFRCLFVARVGLENPSSYDKPLKDIRAGIRQKRFTVEDASVAWDVVWGAIRQAMFRISKGNVRRNYGDAIVQLCLQALGAHADKTLEIMNFVLPDSTDQQRSGRAG